MPKFVENIYFINYEHKNFYYSKLEMVRCNDVHHRSLIYCLGISAETRENIDRIYDFKSGYVKTECLKEGWQTSKSMKVTRLAFDLYCDGAPSVEDYENDNDQLKESMNYWPDELFCCSYAPYFWQAIQIRYPVYTNYEY